MAFNSLLVDLVNDSDNTMDVLYNAMGTVVDMEKKIKQIGEKREYLYQAVEEVREMKKRHVEYLRKEIEECDRISGVVDSMTSDDGDVIRRVLYRPRKEPTMVAQSVSAGALQSITNTLQQAEEEERKQKAEEEERKKKESQIRDIVNKGIMKSSAEDMIGKAWNASALLDRIL